MHTLDKFIEHASPKFKRGFPSNAWVHEAGFESLYVRYTQRPIMGCFRETLDIGSVTATQPGNAAFTRLVERINQTYPDLTLYVENVLNEAFAKKLRDLGFVKVATSRYEEGPPSYAKLASLPQKRNPP